MSAPEERVVCATCGRQAEADAPVLQTWTRGIETGRIVWTCDRCSREHLRSIEGRLEPAWW